MIAERSLNLYEDKIRREKSFEAKISRYSKYCDFIYYKSSINPELTLAMCILKPARPSYILATTHGWHMSIEDFKEYDKPQSEYLVVSVDMRGRAFSEGEQDCNGWELYDIIDAVEFVKENYSEYILDKDIVYFDAASGGGGNAYALAGKFPDYFTHVTAMCGISDYARWYENDHVGEFRDELDIWVGNIQNREAYVSRSGITFVENLCTHIAITHGELDVRVPVCHARNYVEKAIRLGKGELVRYMEVPRVGGGDHFENITEKQMKQMNNFIENDRSKYRKAVQIPRKGEMQIGGYLFTKEFSVILEDINKVARVRYDLDNKEFKVIGADTYVLNT